MGKQNRTVPELVRLKLETLGAEGLRWLADLDDLIAELEQEWELHDVGDSLAGGTEAFVAPATTATGEKVILKIAVPHSEGNTILANEVTALKLARGKGYAQLLHFDLERRVLLLEALGRPLKDFGYSTKEQIDITCQTLQQSWLKLPPEISLPSGAELADWFTNFIANLWEELARPCSESAIERALKFAEARRKAFDPELAVLVHGDAHCGNILQNLAADTAGTPSFKLIDPDGINAEIAYDLGVIMREWDDELIVDPVARGQARCNYLVALTGADREAIWQWGFLQCIASGLLLLKISQPEMGQPLLKIAEAWVKV